MLPNFKKVLVFPCTKAVVFSIALFGFVQISFAVGPFTPGETLDPGCAPGAANCTVLGLTAATTTGNFGIATSSPYAKLSVVGEIVGAYFTGTTTATSTFGGQINVQGTGTSTFTNGLNIAGGCFAVNGTCIGGSGTDIQFSTTSADYWVTTKSTTNLTEGTNLYFTNTRADARINATTSIGTLLSLPSLTDLVSTRATTTQATTTYLSALVASTTHATSTTLYSTTLGINNEYITDLTGSGLSVSGGALTVTTSGDWTGTFDGQEGSYYLANSFATTSANYWLTQQTTSSLTEGSNLYFTTARATTSFIANLAATTSVASITTLSNLTTTGALNSGSITSGFGSIDIGADALTAGAGSLSSLTVSGLTSLGQASSTRLSVFDRLYIGGTATTTIVGNGATSTFQGPLLLSDAGAGIGGRLDLGVPNLNTTASRISVADNGNGGYLTRISTLDDGGNLLPAIYIDTMRGLGVGTSSPSQELAVNGEIFVGGAGTSTFTNGVNILAGCFAINDTCVGGGAGAVSSVSNANGSLTISPTTGSVVASLNLANANIWTALQSFANASTSLLSTLDTLYVGRTATTTISSSAVNLPTGGTFQINSTNVLSGNTLGTGVLTSSLTTVGALNSGSITSGFGSIDIGADALTAGAGSLSSLTVSGQTTLGQASSTLTSILNGLYIGTTATTTIVGNGATSTLSGPISVGATTAGTSTFNGGIQTTYLNVTGASATSTFAKGIDIAAGCFSINGTCVGSGSGVSGGTAGMLTSWTSSSGLTATSGPTASFFWATSTTATSTFANALYVGSSTPTLNQFFAVGSSSALLVVDRTVGNVGIGSSTPSAKLSVTGLGTGTGRAFVISDSAMTERLTFLDRGNLGIGTTTPNWSLQIASSTPYLVLSDTDVSTDARHWLVSALDGVFRIGTSSNALSGTTTLFQITQATTTIFNGLSVGTTSDLIVDYSTGITSIGALETGSFNFEQDAGVVSWMDMNVATTVANILMGYSAQLDANSVISIYGSTTSSGLTTNIKTVIGTTTADVLGSTNIPYNSFLIADGILCVDDGGAANCDDSARTRGTIYAESSTVTAIDIAENYPTKDNTLSAGELVMLDPVNPVFVSRYNATTTSAPVLGIVSTEPGVLLGGFSNELFAGEVKRPIALAGRVPVKVNLDGGAIAIGDHIRPSSVPGVATKATTSGMTLGIALEPLGVTSTSTEILVFVDRQYYTPESQLTISGNGNVGIGNTAPEYKLQVAGDVAATSFVNISTRDAKTDISYLDDAKKDDILARIRGMKIATYRYIGEDTTNPLRMGLIAEEAPVEVLSAGGKGVDVYKLSTFILSGVQAQDRRITSLENRIAMLETHFASSSVTSLTASSTPGMLETLSGFGVKLSASIAEFVGIKAKNIETDSLQVEEGITLKDKKTGEYYCVVIENGALTQHPGKCGGTTLSVPSVPNTTTSTQTTTSTTTPQTETSTSTTPVSGAQSGADSSVAPVTESNPPAPTETTPAEQITTPTEPTQNPEPAPAPEAAPVSAPEASPAPAPSETVGE